MSRVRTNRVAEFTEGAGVTIDDPRFASGPWIDVTSADYGAVGDGSTDDTEAVQAAIDDIFGSDDGGIVFFPTGKYKITSTITMRRSVVLWGVPGSANFYSDTTGVQFIITDKTIDVFAFGKVSADEATGAGIFGIQIWGPAGNTIASLDGTYTGSAVVVGNRTDDNPDDGVFLDHVNISGFGTGVKIHRPNNFIRHCDISTCNTLLHFEGSDPVTDAFGIRGNEVSGCNLHAAKTRFVTVKDGTEVKFFGGTYGSSDSGLGMYFDGAHRCTVDAVTLRLCNGGATVTLDDSYHCKFTGVLNYGYQGSNEGLTKTHGYHFKNGSAYNRITGGAVLRHRQHGILLEGNCPLNTIDGVDIIDNGLQAYNNGTPESAPAAGSGYDGIRASSASTSSLKVIGCTFANTTTYDGTLPQRYAMRSPGGVAFNKLICCENHADNMGEGVTTGFVGDSPRIENNTTDFWTFSAPPASGTWNAGDFALNADRGAVGAPWGWRCVSGGSPGTWAAENIQQGVGADIGDANVTLEPGDEPTQRYATNLSANRTVTLGTTNAVQGYKFTVVRTGLGAFTLDVGGLKTIPSATAASVTVEYSGSAWILTDYSPL